MMISYMWMRRSSLKVQHLLGICLLLYVGAEMQLRVLCPMIPVWCIVHMNSLIISILLFINLDYFLRTEEEREAAQLEMNERLNLSISESARLLDILRFMIKKQKEKEDVPPILNRKMGLYRGSKSENSKSMSVLM